MVRSLADRTFQPRAVRPADVEHVNGRPRLPLLHERRAEVRVEAPAEAEAREVRDGVDVDAELLD